jgi:hypothetical protein
MNSKNRSRPCEKLKNCWATFTIAMCGRNICRSLSKKSARAHSYFGSARAFGRLATGLGHLQQDRQQRRDLRYGEFVGFWEQTQEQAVWGQLRQTLQAPLMQPDDSRLDG